MKKVVKKISGLVGLFILGVGLISCAANDDTSYKTTKVTVILKYQNGNPVVGSTVTINPVESDYSRIYKRAEEIAKEQGIPVRDWDKTVYAETYTKLFIKDTAINRAKTNDKGIAVISVLTQFGDIKFGNLRHVYHDSSTEEEVFDKTYDISSGSVTFILENPKEN